jgi:hypothetical protein
MLAGCDHHKDSIAVNAALRKADMLHEFLNNFLHNLFKPLLLFFYAGFAIPLLNVKFEFPKVLYQGLTMYLLLAIGWHGGEELAALEPSMYLQAVGFMVLGFCVNTIIGITAYAVLRLTTKLRNVDAATVAGYYGSDSAGTFVTCLGVLAAAQIAYAPYMPVMLAVMEIPGCLVALFIVSRLRNRGMDMKGNMPGEAGYLGRPVSANNRAVAERQTAAAEGEEAEFDEVVKSKVEEKELVGATTGGGGFSSGKGGNRPGNRQGRFSHENEEYEARADAIAAEAHIALESQNLDEAGTSHSNKKGFDWGMLHEVFLNPGIYLLFAGIGIGFISRLQGAKVTMSGDQVFNNLFQGLLCLFLLEMGITAARKLKDLKTAGWPFIAFALIAPNCFAILGMLAAHGYSLMTGVPMEVGTYTLFAVLCGAASYIAVPAVQRLAIPEASPTLPLAASLGLTFSYNVTIGIPVYILIANLLSNAPAVAAGM